MFKQHPRVAVAVVSMAVTAGLAVPASPAGAAAFTNACKNSVTANSSQINVDMTAVSPDPVPPDASFGLTNIQQTANVPGSLFVAGYNLGLLQQGQNTIPATVSTVIEGTNTVEGLQQTPFVDTSISTTISDPDGTPSTGDETATDGTLSATYPDQAWTASGPSGSTIDFREDTREPLSVAQNAEVGGLIIRALVGGFLNVRFACSPGTVTGPDPGVVAFMDPAASFARSAISASAPPPPPPPTPTPAPTPIPTTPPASVVNTFSLRSVKLNRRLGTARLTLRVPGSGTLVLAKTAQVKRDAERPKAAGLVRLDVKSRGQALRRLNRTGSVKVTARITYTPTGGEPRTKVRRLKLVKRVSR